ncbi:MAG: hypothetical protein K0Q53_140 [Massilibacillus sp.]|jgi:hypothetical protein|nr:hypothetical protein [Massilibacillus sp.]
MTVDERKDLLYALASNYIIESEKTKYITEKTQLAIHMQKVY